MAEFSESSHAQPQSEENNHDPSCAFSWNGGCRVVGRSCRSLDPFADLKRAPAGEENLDETSALLLMIREDPNKSLASRLSDGLELESTRP
jgi:hypothetical protein